MTSMSKDGHGISADILFVPGVSGYQICCVNVAPEIEDRARMCKYNTDYIVAQAGQRVLDALTISALLADYQSLYWE